MEAGERSLQGKDVIKTLAEIYPQLYLIPGEEGAAAYADVVRAGQTPSRRSLAHFRGHALDSCVREETPAGTVPVITLGERADFEVFLQIMAHRCTCAQIPRTQGAAILDGVVNWTKIREHEAAYLAAGGTSEGWSDEFARFTADKANYKDALIVLSVGPYSAVDAARAGFSEEEWLSYSHAIRKAHECTHFICRRLYPALKDAVWDERVADDWKTMFPGTRTGASAWIFWRRRSTPRCAGLKRSSRTRARRRPMNWRSGWRRRSNAGSSLEEHV